MNKFKTYCAVILYLATNSVYAVRGFESTVSHMQSPLSVRLCGLVEPKKSELDKFLEVAEEMDCTSKEDIQEHCSCIKKISAKPLSTPMKNNFLAEFGFLVESTNAGHTKLLRDLANFNSALGTYGPGASNAYPLNPDFISCLDNNDLDVIEENLKADFEKSADTKVGTPALYRDDYLKEIRSSNEIKLMDNASKEADAALIEDISKFIAEKEKNSKPSKVVQSFSVMDNPFSLDQSPLLEKAQSNFLEDSSEVISISTIQDLNRAVLVSEFLSTTPLIYVKYAKSPLFKIYQQTYDRGKSDVSDYIGRVASRTGFIDKAGINGALLPFSDLLKSEIVQKAASKIPISTFLDGECERLKEEVKKSVSSNYTPLKSPASMNFVYMYKAEETGRRMMEKIKNLDSSYGDGNINSQLIKYYRSQFKERYKENLKVFDSEKANYILKTKDFHFSQLICSKIEVDKKVEEIVSEIEKSKDSEEFLEKVQETKDKLNILEINIGSNRLDIANLENEKTSLIADNVALENRSKETSLKLREATQNTSLTFLKNAKGSLDRIETNINKNNIQLEKVHFRLAEVRESNEKLFAEEKSLKDNISLPSQERTKSASPLVPLDAGIVTTISDDKDFQNQVRDSFLRKEIASFIIESKDESKAPIQRVMLTGKKDVPKNKVISQNIETGDFEMISTLEETKRVLESDSDRLSTQTLALLDNEDLVNPYIAEGLARTVEFQSRKITNIIEGSKGQVTETGDPVLETLNPSLTQVVDVSIAAQRVVDSNVTIKRELALAIAEDEEIDHGEAPRVRLTNYLVNSGLGDLISDADVNVAATLKAGRKERIESSPPSDDSLNERIASSFTTGGIFFSDSIEGIEDLDQIGEGLAEATLKKLEERGLDVSGLTPTNTSLSNGYETTIEAKKLEATKRDMRAEVAAKKGKLKGMEIGNIALSKKMLGERRSVNKIKDYSGLTPATSASKDAAKEEANVAAEKKIDKSASRVGQSGKKDELVGKTTSISENKNINQEVMSRVKPESNKLVDNIKRELRKTKAIKKALPRRIAKTKSTSGGGQNASASGPGGGEVSSVPSPRSERSPSNYESPKKAKDTTKINFDDKGLAFNEKAYEVSLVLEGVDSDLYVRLPNFDTPKGFLDYSVEKRNKWIEEQFKSSKSLEAIVVLPDGQKVLVRKKD